MLFVVVNHLSKQLYSIPCYKTINAHSMAKLFLKYIQCHKGYPNLIVLDYSPQFVSNFWNALCVILGVKVKLSTTNSPQTNSQTKNLNQYINQHLYLFVNYYQSNQSSMLPMLDNTQLTLPYNSISMSPFYLSQGYSLCCSFNQKAPKPATTTKEKLTLAKAKAFAKQLQSGQDTARKIIGAAQEKKAHFVNKTH